MPIFELKDKQRSTFEKSRIKHLVLRKLDFTLLPILCIIYLLSYLDRSNIANARLAGIEEDTHLTNIQYQWSLSIFFIGYILCEVPSNLILRRWRASKWIAIIMLAWGIVAVCMAAIKSFVGLIICRFLLGVFEAGLFPGIIYYMSLWYKRKEQAVRLGLFWSFSSLAGLFSGLIAYGIMQIKSPLSHWQLIFIIEGVPTILLAVFCWIFLPDSPEQCRFLNEEERSFEINRLAKDAGAAGDRSFSWAQVLSVFKDWKTYVYMVIYITGSVALQSITLFLPSIISGMGKWDDIKTQLMTIPPYCVAFITTILLSFSSDHFVERSLHMVFINVISMCGFLILIFVNRQQVFILYFGAILVTAGVYANVLLKIVWFNNNFAGLTRRAVAGAAIVSFGTIGGVISSQIYPSSTKPKYYMGNAISLSCVGIQAILAILLRLVFMYENRRRSHLNDEQKIKEIQYYGGVELAGDHHPDFRYTL
ncbi:unnamed protein product [Didymodactylos carnosus]|uniref:Major facilitator superfamily (MFS) profile domain-containing protein n=1 Tax=Didymodactylos carnosus TaxID=1234261 RepID=A0A814B9E3_9BILA|nr:unnamed protein product [Didymodactylos carnosus]CAF0924505.1 unnamed protein product [Didymodactylos carnosus]CAF3630642.1 unnamed protein product [Didymodactylos carnosus]CAF3703402.1 unnamed protein product [Didymodactylos carnosus]